MYLSIFSERYVHNEAGTKNLNLVTKNLDLTYMYNFYICVVQCGSRQLHTCDTSRIMREAPEFKPYLPHSHAGLAISRILNFAIMIFSHATIFTAIGTHF